MLERVVIGTAAGYVAERCMELTTSAFYALQSDESKLREEQALPGGAILATGRQVAATMNIVAEDQTVRRLGLIVHTGVVSTYGASAALLVGAGVRPLRAGVLIAVAAFVLVDEALNAVRLEPSPFDFPVEAHMRGLVGHAAFGIALGAALAAARPLITRGTNARSIRAVIRPR